jgi:hypothetical protein
MVDMSRGAENQVDRHLAIVSGGRRRTEGIGRWSVAGDGRTDGEENGRRRE